jgi:hypothetical protein
MSSSSEHRSHLHFPDDEPTSDTSDGRSVSTSAGITHTSSGKALALAMEKLNYHPVIVFGHSNSGKTTLLLSLIAFLTTDAQAAIGIRLGQPMLDLTQSDGIEMWERAQRIFGINTQAFIDGTAPDATATRVPFFVPLVISPSGGEEVRLALMDSNGEWYAPNPESPAYYPELRPQLRDFFINYSGRLSLLHVLPRTQLTVNGDGSGHADDRRMLQNADSALRGAIDEYNKHRADRSDDAHMMLVTKWDAQALAHGQALAQVLVDNAQAVRAFIKTNAPQAFTSLEAIRTHTRSLELRAYCAGRINGKQLRYPLSNSDLDAVIRDYPRQLWRWLYRQASDGKELPLPPPPQRPWYERWSSYILDMLFPQSGR